MHTRLLQLILLYDAEMKRTRIILFCIFLSSISVAQEFKDFAIAAFAGAQYQWSKNQSIDSYVDSYNKNLSTKLNAPLNYLAPKFGINYGGEIRFSICRIGVMGSRIRSESSAHFKNGGERVFSLKMNEVDWYIDLMKPNQKSYKIGFTIASHYQNAILFSQYKFANGYKSSVASGDGALSGIYRFRGDNLIGLGLRLEKNFGKRVRFVVKAEYTKLGVKSNLLVHKDEMYNTILGGTVYSDGQPALYFPIEYTNSNNLYFNTVGNNCIYDAFRGMRMTAQLHIVLYKRNEE